MTDKHTVTAERLREILDGCEGGPSHMAVQRVELKAMAELALQAREPASVFISRAFDPMTAYMFEPGPAPEGDGEVVRFNWFKPVGGTTMLPHARDDGDWVRYADHISEVTRLKGEVERLTRERDGALGGLQSIVNCQSPLTQNQMREAASDALEAIGVKPVSLPNQSPYVIRAETAEASLAEAVKVIEYIARMPIAKDSAYPMQTAARSFLETLKVKP